MLEKLDAIEEKYGDLERRMLSPEVYNGPGTLRQTGTGTEGNYACC